MRPLLLLLLALPGSAAQAQALEPPAAEPTSEPGVPDAGVPAAAEAGWKKVVEALGYVSSRTSFTRSRSWGLVPTDDQPQLQELLEVNTQLKVKVKDRSYLSLDVSLLGDVAGEYHGQGSHGQDVRLADHQTTAAQPLVSINELYLFHDFLPQLNVVLGKKRITWGSGLAYNPTDLLNPRRDPTDPTFQRAGAWVAQLEAPLEAMTFSLLFAPTVLGSTNGIPTAFLVYPTWNQLDTQAHYQLAARWYALLFDADVTAMLFYGNASVDAFTDKLRGGLSLARYFFTDYELHVEALLQTGSARDFLTPACVASLAGALQCVASQTPATQKRLLDDATLYPRILVGTKRQFSDDSLLSLEYLYQADGWSPSQFQDFANGLGLLESARAAGLPVSRVPGVSALLGQGTGSDGLPVRVSFDPRRRHYAFLTYNKPNIFDDFTLQVVALASLEDLSVLWSMSVAWAATQWLTLTAYGFAPTPGLDSLSARTLAGTRVSEFGSAPFAVRALFEARVFF
jgi:hypothetical protein